MRKSVWLLAPATLLLGMCARAGSPEDGTRALTLEAFDQLDVSSALSVIVHVGAEARGEIRGRAAEIGQVRVVQHDGRLSLDLGRHGEIKGGIEIELWTPSLKELGLSGASRAELSGLKADQLDLDISGASHAVLEGQARVLSLELSGAATLEAKACRVEQADVELSGASNAELTVQQELSAECSGASRLEYWGKPVVREMESSGAASVRAHDAK